MPDSTPAPAGSPRGEIAAAVDLGSNSFHMIVAELSPAGELRVIDRMKHRVRLAAGLDEEGRLSAEAQQRAIDSLELMGQRLQNVRPDCIRAVATNTLRRARNTVPFLVRANRALGHRIDVISGHEEARLIYQGVGYDLPRQGRSLVVDIGGGSTEVIIGEGGEPLALDSLYMGCVSFSMRYFPDGRITREAMKRAETAARLELQPVKRQYRKLGWTRAVGSSGTIRAIDAVLRNTGLSPEGITPRGLSRLRKLLVDVGRIDKLALEGLSETRRPVLPGGVAILRAVIEALKVERMTASNRALREGVILDLVGRRTEKDARAVTVERLALRFGLDRVHAARVRRTAQELFDLVAAPWGLDGDSSLRRMLGWAADLHELGLAVSHAGYHKHGAYLLQHGDLGGFSTADQEALAALVLSHRGRLDPERIGAIHRGPLDPILRTAVLLRLAYRIHRSRALRQPVVRVAEVGPSTVTLLFGAYFFDNHPLTRAELTEEAAVLQRVGLKLTVVEAGPEATPPAGPSAPPGR